MITDRFKLSGCDAELRLYLYDHTDALKYNDRPLILVCPGGGYCHLSDREGETMALQFMAMGYHAAVLMYSLSPVTYPAQFYEIGAAMKHLKDHAAEYHILSDKIVVCGFSAGAHLAGSLGCNYNDPGLLEKLQVSRDYLKPAAQILAYPVITSGEFAHRGSFDCLLGDRKEDPELLKKVSLENCVDEDTVPAFIWHTFADQAVPLENSLLFAAALRKNKVPFEYHVFPTGCHGLGLANDLTLSNAEKEIDAGAEQWIGLCRSWLNRTLQ